MKKIIYSILIGFFLCSASYAEIIEDETTREAQVIYEYGRMHYENYQTAYDNYRIACENYQIIVVENHQPADENCRIAYDNYRIAELELETFIEIFEPNIEPPMKRPPAGIFFLRYLYREKDSQKP